MPVVPNDSSITKNLTQAEIDLGVDLKINMDGDLELNNLSDFNLVAGGANAAQAIRLKLEIESGGLLYHPNIGTDLQIGEKIKDAFLIKTQILKSLGQDPRFENVDVLTEINGGVILITLRVTIKETGLSVPLQFVVQQ